MTKIEILNKYKKQKHNTYRECDVINAMEKYLESYKQDHALQLQQTGVSGCYSKKIAFENIEQMLIEKLADFLDSEDISIIEKDANLKDPVKREESFLHIRMAKSAMREYKLTMFGL